MRSFSKLTWSHMDLSGIVHSRDAKQLVSRGRLFIGPDLFFWELEGIQHPACLQDTFKQASQPNHLANHRIATATYNQEPHKSTQHDMLSDTAMEFTHFHRI